MSAGWSVPPVPNHGRACSRRHPGYCAVSLVPLLQATRTVPIVFVAVQDPVGAGFVDSLSRPGGIATGFVLFDYSLSTRRALFGSGSRSEKVARGHRYCCPIDIECNPERISTFSHHFDLLA